MRSSEVTPGPSDLGVEQPLAGVRVLDLSTLLPGPLTTLLLAEAGADVIKIERPGAGDEMRSYQPKLGTSSANFALLNRGKRAYAADLKEPRDRERLLSLARQADVFVEQFRPGVAERLGVGYEQISAINASIVYCSISGYGQVGPHAARAGHDVNYLAESGLLNVVTDSSGKPQLPFTVVADIAGGTYPAVMNILLGLLRRERTGRGSRIDIGMARNLQTLAYGYLATQRVTGTWPTPSGELLTGGSPRYQIYRTADHRYIAAAPLEQKFWEEFTQLIGLSPEMAANDAPTDAVIAAIGAIIESQTSDYWETVFAGQNVCASVVATFEEGVAAGLVELDSADRLYGAGYDVTPLHTPVDPCFRGGPRDQGYPDLQPLPAATNTLWSERP